MCGMCVCVCLQYFDMSKDKKYGLFKTYFYRYNAVNTKTIKSVTMLSQSGFWLKTVQSETSECSALPSHVSHRCHDSQVVINHLHNRISHYFENIVVHTVLYVSM